MREKERHLTNSPPLAPAPRGFIELLRDADALLELMGREPLDVVGNLAMHVTTCANDAGAHDIANAANAVSRIVSAHDGAALAGAMQRLVSAISRAQHTYQLDAA